HCATKRSSTTRPCAESNAILIWPKPGFSGQPENRQRRGALFCLLQRLGCLRSRRLRWIPSPQSKSSPVSHDGMPAQVKLLISRFRSLPTTLLPQIRTNEEFVATIPSKLALWTVNPVIVTFARPGLFKPSILNPLG